MRAFLQRVPSNTLLFLLRPVLVSHHMGMALANIKLIAKLYEIAVFSGSVNPPGKLSISGYRLEL